MTRSSRRSLGDSELPQGRGEKLLLLAGFARGVEERDRHVHLIRRRTGPVVDLDAVPARREAVGVQRLSGEAARCAAGHVPAPTAVGLLTLQIEVQVRALPCLLYTSDAADNLRCVE